MRKLSQLKQALLKKEADLDMIDDQIMSLPNSSVKFDSLAQKREDMETDIRQLREGIEVLNAWDTLKGGDWSDEMKQSLGEIDPLVVEMATGEADEAPMTNFAPEAPLLPPAPAVEPPVEEPAPMAPPPVEENTMDEIPSGDELAGDAGEEPPPITASSKKSNFQTPSKKGTLMTARRKMATAAISGDFWHQPSELLKKVQATPFPGFVLALGSQTGEGELWGSTRVPSNWQELLNVVGNDDPQHIKDLIGEGYLNFVKRSDLLEALKMLERDNRAGEPGISEETEEVLLRGKSFLDDDFWGTIPDLEGEEGDFDVTASSKKSNFQTPSKKGTPVPTAQKKGNTTMATATQTPKSSSLKDRIAAIKSKRAEAINKEAQTRVASAWTVAKTLLPTAPDTIKQKLAESLLANTTKALKAICRQTARNAAFQKTCEAIASVTKTTMNDLMENPSILSSEENAVKSELKGQPKDAAGNQNSVYELMTGDGSASGFVGTLSQCADYLENRADNEGYSWNETSRGVISGQAISKDGQSMVYSPDTHKWRPSRITESETGRRLIESSSKRADDRKDAGSVPPAYPEPTRKEPAEIDAGKAGNREKDTVDKTMSDQKVTPKEAAKAKKSTTCDTCGKDHLEGECKMAAKKDASKTKKAGPEDMAPPAAGPTAPPVDEGGDMPMPPLPEEGEGEEKPEGESEEVVGDEEKLEVVEQIDEVIQDIEQIKDDIEENSEELNLESIFDNDKLEDKEASLANNGNVTAGEDDNDFLPSSAQNMEASMEESPIGDMFDLTASDADPMARLLGSTKYAEVEASLSKVVKPGDIAQTFKTDAVGKDPRDNETDHEDSLMTDILKSLDQDDYDTTRDQTSHQEEPTESNTKVGKKSITKLKTVVAAAPAAQSNLASLLFSDDDM